MDLIRILSIKFECFKLCYLTGYHYKMKNLIGVLVFCLFLVSSSAALSAALSPFSQMKDKNLGIDVSKKVIDNPTIKTPSSNPILVKPSPQILDNPIRSEEETSDSRSTISKVEK